MPDRVGAVVLAAGAGSRFGGGKLLASLHGRPILQHVLDRLAAAEISRIIVVLGHEAEAIEGAIGWRSECRVRNPDPSRGLSSSLAVGIEALDPDLEAALIVLGDQPQLAAEAIRALLAAAPHPDHPIVVPVYALDRGRNPVLLRRPAFALLARTSGDRGLGPLIEAHPELVQEVPVPDVPDNPDIDNRADLVRMLEMAWTARVRANEHQVDRFREVPDGTDFYAPVSGLFRADPTRTDEPALAILLDLIRPGETWLDIGAGAGRYALPIARALAPSGGAVIAVDASAGMLAGLREIASEHAIANVRVIEGRWPPPIDEAAAFAADVALIAHVGYDVAEIGAFVRAMEASVRRLCVAVLMERQPSSIADVCWPSVWGEERMSLPALPELLELLRAKGRAPVVLHLQREPRRFGSRKEIEDYLRRQLWVRAGSAADARFLAALESFVVEDLDGKVGLRDQRPLPIGIVTWEPGRPE